MPSDPKQPLLADECLENIGTAAWVLEDAIAGESCEEYPKSRQAREYHIKVQKAEKLYNKALVGLVLLSFVEVPSWCKCHDAKWEFLAGRDRCKPPGHPDALMFLSGVSYLPTGFGVMVELTCMYLVLRKFLMQWEREVKYFQQLEPPVRYKDYREIWTGIFITCLGFVDCAVFFFFRNNWRIVLITRSGLLLMLPSVRNLGKVAIAVIWDVCSIMMFLLGTILMFAWVSVTLFHDYRQKNIEGVEINEGFTSFHAAFYSMFLASVTEEAFIEKFLPTFTAFRVTGFLWLFFLVLVHLLLLNLVLDTLVAGYAKVSERNIDISAENQAEGVLRAFAELCKEADDSDDLEISKNSFMLLLAELGRSPNLRNVIPVISSRFFEAVDRDGSGMIDQNEFIDICKVVNYDFWLTRYDSGFKEMCPSIWDGPAHTWFRKFYYEEKFDAVMNGILLINFGMIILESYYDLSDWEEPPMMQSLEAWFSLIYVIELLLNLSVISWGEFWSSAAKKFDFWTTIILCFNTALAQSQALDAFFHVDSRYANMLRVFRLLRVLKTVKRLDEVKFLTSTILKIVQLSREIMTLLAVIIFIFSQISVQLFGGLLYVGNPALEGTEYKEANWFVINYNDLLMAIATYFVSLLVEFTPVLAEVLERIAPFKCMWLITLFYYLIAVAVVFELVQAFTIETFVELYTRKGEPEEEIFSGYTMVEEEFTAKGMRIHYNTYMARGEQFAESLEKAFAKILNEETSADHGHAGVTDIQEANRRLGRKATWERENATIQELCSHNRADMLSPQGHHAGTPEHAHGHGAAVSIHDFYYLGHLSPEEEAMMHKIAESRKHRRASINPFVHHKTSHDNLSNDERLT